MTDFDRPASGMPGPEDAPPPTDPNATAAVPVPTDPALEAGRAPRPRDRVRWLAAASLIVVVVRATAAVTLMLTGSTAPSTVQGYVPADSVMYGEMRLDLPGDQRQKLGQFLSKFPGFADQAALDTKLDEVLDRLVAQGTHDKQTYTKDVKPWFDGEVAFAVGPIPSAPATDPAAMAKAARALLILSIKDEAVARSWFTATLGEAGVSGTPQDYAGTQLTVFDSPKPGGPQAAYAITGGKVAVVGDVASVKAAIDTRGAGALAKTPSFTAAKAALTGDDLGFMVIDMKSLVDASTRLSGTLASAPPLSDALRKLVPDWAAMRLRVEGDALVADGVYPHVAALPGAKENRANGVAAYAPASTIALVAGNDLGRSVLDWIALYRAEPSLADAFKQIDQAANFLGGLDQAVGWLGDTGIVVARAGDGIEGGLISIPADTAGGQRLLTTLRSFVQLGGTQAGMTTRDEPYAGETITILDLGTVRGLAGVAGSMGGVPVDPSALPDDHVEIAYTATDKVVVIGSSPEFVQHVLDAGSGANLAKEARFSALLGRVGATHNGVQFVDLAAIRGLVEHSMASASAADRANYDTSIKPFLTPFDALIAAGAVGGELDQAHLLVTVK
jgi:hypothetical protein